MRSRLFIASALIVAAYFAGRTGPRRDEASCIHQGGRATLAATEPETVADYADASPTRAKAEPAVPAEFEGIDFKNFSYPVSLRKQPVRLKDGEYEYYRDESLVGSGWFTFEGVGYTDVTGDGRKEAVVRVSSVSCGGGSCDGSWRLIYIYSAAANKPALLWRIETGSFGYGCGLKSLAVDGGEVAVEVFNDCRFEGVSLDHRNEPPDHRSGYKFGTDNAFTRFRFAFDGRAFALKKREVFPFPQDEVRNFEPEIHVGDD